MNILKTTREMFYKNNNKKELINTEHSTNKDYKYISGKLKNAIEINDIYSFKHYIDQISYIDNDISKLILNSSKDKANNMIKYIVDNNKKNVDELFYVSLIYGNIDVAVYLEEGGFDIFKYKHRYEKPLFLACIKGDMETIKYLHKNGIDVNRGLAIAIQFERTDLINYMLNNGADIDIHIELANGLEKDKLIKFKTQKEKEILEDDLKKLKQSISFHLVNASSEGNIEKVKSLINQGADIHFVDDSAIQLAAKYGHIDVVKYLHQNGVGINKAIEIAEGIIKEEIIDYKTSIDEDVLLSQDFNEVVLVKSNKSSRRI